MSGESQKDVLLTHAAGLHARPAVTFTKVAKSFMADISFSADAGASWIDAKSIVKVMGAKVPSGKTLMIKANGDDAERAVDALVSLVQADFEASSGELRRTD